MENERIIFDEEVYDVMSIERYIKQNVLPNVPYETMQDLKNACDVRFDRYGFVHCCTFFVVIIEHGESRQGTGWDTIEQDYRGEMAYLRELQNYAVGYDYLVD